MDANAGTACTSPAGGKCDGAGHCVQCLTSGDCSKGEACGALSTCVPVTCAPGGTIAMLVQGSNVTAYVANGSYNEQNAGVRAIAIEGNYPSATTASNCDANGCTITTNVVNTCAVDPSLGQVVCTGNAGEIYLIDGVAVSSMLTTAAATAMEEFSGGICNTCGVSIDPLTHTGFISIGTSAGAALQPLTLGANPVLGNPIPLNGQMASGEGIVVDLVRGLVLSPNENGDFQLVDLSTGVASDFSPPGDVNSPAYLTSAAEDCTTGVALAAGQFSDQVLLVDLTQVTFSVPGASWTAPSTAFKYQTVAEFSPFGGGDSAIAATSNPTLHLGAIAGSFGGNLIGVFQLPSTSGSSAPTPTLKDWVVATIPNTPTDNKPWGMGQQPYAFTAYTSPSNGRQYIVTQDDVTLDETRTWLAVIDMNALLFDTPRSDGLTPSTGTTSHTIGAAISSCLGAPSATSGCVVGFIKD